jgi:hypothetical protein
MDEIFRDNDVQYVFDLAGQGTVAPKLDDLDDHDRQLFMQFVHADQDPEKLATPAGLVAACVAGTKAFEQLSDPMPRSWSAGWKKFILYITALNTQTLWDRFQNETGRAYETAIFADWVVFSIGHSGWGPDGNSTPLGKQHSYCMAVAAEAGGGIKMNPRTGRYEAPDGSAARNYSLAAELAGAPVERSVSMARTQMTDPAPSGAQGDEQPPAASRWEVARERARQVQQHINPLALQHGIESVQGALTESKVAKVDNNTGRLKIRKLGVARAAIQPTKTLRRAVEGAALADHLKAYNESAAAAQPDRAAGGASSAAEFASYAAKRDYLRDWARRLAVAAGVPPTEQLVMRHAEMAATGIRAMVFLRRLGAPQGIANLDQYFRDGIEPAYPALDTLDVLYASVVMTLDIQQQVIDEAIVAFLDSCWPEWVEGVRDRPIR